MAFVCLANNLLISVYFFVYGEISNPCVLANRLYSLRFFSFWLHP